VADFINGIQMSNLRELPRDQNSLSFDPSRPPPISSSNVVPEHTSNYYDSSFPVPHDTDPATGLPYPAVSYEPTIAREPRSSRTPEIHTAVSVDETAAERSSKERDLKPLTNKEKKRMEIAGREIWKYVAVKLQSDSIFLKKKKKRADSEEEDMKEKAEKCVVRIAQKLEKGGYKEARLWVMLKDNEKGVAGFCDEMKVAIMSGHIEVDRESKKPKDRLDTELIDTGAFFRYIGEYITDSLSGRLAAAEARSKEVSPVASTTPTVPAVILDNPRIQLPGEPHYDFCVRSFQDLNKFTAVQLIHTLSLDVEEARSTAALYGTVLAIANYNILSLEALIRNYTPPPAEFEGEPEQTIYGHLLELLRDIPFEKYPMHLSNNLDTHQTNIVRICLEYFTQTVKQKSPSPASKAEFVRTVGEEEDGFVGPMLPTEEVPVGGNTENQLPQRRYVIMAVSVDTVSVDGRLVAWQVSVHVPGLPEDEDPDYECLMLPNALEERPQQLGDLGFTYDMEKQVYYHQGTEFGRRKAESEDISLEKFANYLDEMRSGLKGAGKNNGLVLLFETGEDLHLVKQLFNKHRHDVFLDCIKGLTCLDHYMRVSRPGRSAAYTWPSYQHKVGEGGKWTASITSNASTVEKIEAITKPECVYKICVGLAGGVQPSYNNFTKWFCYPSNHPEISNMTVGLEHTLELLPLQNFIDRQLFTNRVELKLEGVFAARSEVESLRPYNACARQTVRRLVVLGFNLEVLKKSFRSDPNFEIPSSVFLQDLTEVQKLRLHEQTDIIRKTIKQYFNPQQAAMPQPTFA